MQELRLKNETRLRNILVAFAVAILAASILLLRNTSLKRRNEKLKNDSMTRELQHKTAEMEMQALRAQMNPHFIFKENLDITGRGDRHARALPRYGKTSLQGCIQL